MKIKTAEVAKTNNVTSALLIDDAFDLPRAVNVSGQVQPFIDELRDDVTYALVASLLNEPDLNEDRLIELLDEDHVIRSLYERKSHLPADASAALFLAYEQTQAVKKAELEPIVSLLQELGLSVIEAGTEPIELEAPVDLILVDLFFSDLIPTDAATDAASKIAPYVDKSDSRPSPLVILISSQLNYLASVNQTFRELAKIPGCRFRYIAKRDFRESVDEALYRLYRLIQHHPNSSEFERFIQQVDKAAGEAKTEFIDILRKFELSDYAYLADLVVQSEGIPLKDYLLDLFALSWATITESNQQMTAALSDLDALNLTVEKYAPNAFAPSEAVVQLYHRALYKPRESLPTEDGFVSLAMGDILEAGNDFGAVPRLLFVIVQDCDMARGDSVDSAFLIEGKVGQTPLFRKKGDRAFPYVFQGQPYVVTWNPKQWRSVRRQDFAKLVAEHAFVRSKRMRSPWSLACQTQFFQYLSRPAEMAPPHSVRPTDLQVLLSDARNRGRIVIDDGGPAKGYLLSGRAGDEPVIRLVLSADTAKSLRDALRQASDNSDLYGESTANWARTTVNDPNALDALQRGLVVDTDGKKTSKNDMVLDGAGTAEKKWWLPDQTIDPAFSLVMNVKTLDISD